MKRYLIAAAAMLAAVPAANAATLIDTGTPTGSATSLFGVTPSGYVQYLAGLATISSDSTITSISTYGITASGKLRVSIYSGSNPSKPTGAALISTAFQTVSASSPSWFGVSGLSISLAAGQYWFSFEPDTRANGGIDAAVYTDVPSPLPGNAFSSEWPTLPTWYASGDTYPLRIEGTVAGSTPAVPEPATWAMLVVGIGAMGGAMRRAKASRVRFA